MELRPMRIRIEGIYDERTFQILEEEAISDFSFDFRPKSFNFLQQYRFMEMMSLFHAPRRRYYCHFCNESPSVIEKITSDIQTELSLSKSHWNESFFLEFSGDESPDFMESYGMPFFWHYSSDQPLEAVLECRCLGGIILEYDFLHRLHESEQLYDFREKFLELSVSFFRDRRGEFFLRRNWDSDIFPSLYEIFNFTAVSVPVDSKIELSYRQVDTEKMRWEIKNINVQAFSQ